MLYSQELIDQVCEANNIVDVIGSYVNLTKKGSTYFGLCPFHNEKTPSFSVTDNGTKQMFYCFGCHAGGSVLTFLMKYENLTYTEALKVLAERAGITLPKPDYSKAASEKARKKEEIMQVNKEAATYFFHLLKSPRGRKAYEYLTGRGLSNDTIVKFGLGYSDKYRDDLYNYLKGKGYSDELLNESALVSVKESDVHDTFWNRVMFPIMDTRNRVVAFGGRVMGDGEPKYLNSRETIVFEKSRTLFGLNEARKYRGRFLILCEGYMDVISLHQAGFNNAVASLGTALTDGHAGILKRYTDHVVISYDSDGAGKDAALRAIPKLKNAGVSVKVADLSPYKDPDELIKAMGASEYAKRLDEAVNGLLFELGMLSRSFDLSDPDEKTRFGNESANRLSYITDELERENYIQIFCRQYGFDYDIFKRIVKKHILNHDGKEYQTPVLRNENNIKKGPTGLEQSQKLLLAFIAEDKSYYDRISHLVDASDFNLDPYNAIASLLFSQLAGDRLNIAGIISALEDTDDQEKAADILNFDFRDMSEEDKLKTLNDCVINVRQNTIKRLMEQTNDAAVLVDLRRQMQEIGRIRVF